MAVNYLMSSSDNDVKEPLALIDSDEDGISDSKEAELGTDPENNDSDGDGQNDGAEVMQGSDPSDGDDMFTDSDEDGLSDEYEDEHGLDKQISDKNKDLDLDGLTNVEEMILGSNPDNSDSDGDGQLDGAEVIFGSDALDKDIAFTDSDGDGLSDDYESENGMDANDNADALSDSDNDGLNKFKEVVLGLDADKADSDNDGQNDGLEVSFGSNPTDGSVLYLDSDEDGLSDDFEVANNQNPNDSNDGINNSESTGTVEYMSIVSSLNSAEGRAFTSPKDLGKIEVEEGVFDDAEDLESTEDVIDTPVSVKDITGDLNYFSVGSSSLNPNNSKIKELLDQLNLDASLSIIVTGHTDDTGSEELNQSLSVSRAKAVANFLTANGIASSRVKTIGKGENEPAYSNDTEEGRRKNRRVEITK